MIFTGCRTAQNASVTNIKCLTLVLGVRLKKSKIISGVLPLFPLFKSRKCLKST